MAGVSAPDLRTVVSGPWTSALALTQVRHRRHRPAVHQVDVSTFHVLVDVDELPRLGRAVRGFGHNRRAMVAVHDDDHLGGPEPSSASGPRGVPLRTLRERAAALVAERGATLPAGPLLLLCHPRMFGHVFNPVAWWFAHHPDGRLGLVLAEVSSTFGDRVVYLLDEFEPGSGGTIMAQAAKRLHVSPFLPVEDHTYRFVIRPPDLSSGPGMTGPRVLVQMQVEDAHGTVLDATQDARLVPFASGRLLRLILRYPLVSLRSVLHIHLHALLLWRKRVPFVHRPQPPVDAVRVGRVVTERTRRGGMT